jgi:putative ABC transport system permease protein
MIKNYFTTAFRNILRSKITSFINILGLGLGIGVFMLIFLFVVQEFKVDKFIKDKERIFRLEAGEWALLGPGFGQKVKAICPEVEEAFSTQPQFMQNMMVRVGDESIRISEYMPVTNSMPTQFGFNILLGNSENPLSSTYDLVLTQSEAKRLFGDDNPIGKTITIYDKYNLTVTAVIEDPLFFHIPFRALLSFDILPALYGWKDMENMIFNNMNNPTYLKLASIEQMDLVIERITKYIEEQSKSELPFALSLRPVEDIYFNGALQFEGKVRHGNPKFIGVMIVVAILILFLACVNYINLSTARASTRSKEIGVRKVVGGSRLSIVFQFLGESILLVLFALIVGIALVELASPVFGTLIERELSTNLLISQRAVLIIVAGGVLLGVISGLYPSVYLSSFSPTKVLKGKVSDGAKGNLFRKVLIVFQFTVSVLLIISTLVIFSQLRYFTSYELGFDKDQIINLNIPRNTTFSYDVLKEKVQNISTVKGISRSNSKMGNIGWQESYRDEHGNTHNFSYIPIDPDFIEVMGLEVIDGRNFDWNRPSDVREKIIVNETMARHIGIEKAGNKMLSGGFIETEVIGIVKDFNFNSLHSGIGPLGLHFRGRDYNTYNIKVDTDNLGESIKQLNMVWDEYAVDEPFEYSFLNESFEESYRSEKRMGQMFGYFAVIAIFIGCMGLFGLSAFILQARVKEMGIRKVLGASTLRIVGIMGREFAILVIISNAIAWPIAFYAMSNWLQSFPYRTSISILFFVVALLMSLAIAFFTVAYHSWKTASANPVDSLKYE